MRESIRKFPRLLVFSLALLISFSNFSFRAIAGGRPSFDCKKASRPIEKAICASENISELDQKLSRRFSAWLAVAPAGGGVNPRKEQRAWIANRDKRCMEKINSPKLLDTCLASEYQSRLFALTDAIVKASHPMPYHQPGAEGGLIVVTRSDQTLYVNIATSTGEQNYTCEVEVDMPAPVNGKSSTLIPVGDFERDLYKQGCKLTLSFGDEGATVDAEGDSCHSFCGLNGYFAGKYLKRTRK